MRKNISIGIGLRLSPLLDVLEKLCSLPVSLIVATLPRRRTPTGAPYPSTGASELPRACARAERRGDISPSALPKGGLVEIDLVALT